MRKDDDFCYYDEDPDLGGAALRVFILCALVVLALVLWMIF